MAFCRTLIDDVDKVIAVAAFCFGVAEHALDFCCESFCEFLYFFLRTKCVIGCDASLACVERFAPSDLLDDAFDFYVGEENRRRFPAEFKRDACVILCRFFCNVRSDFRAPSKEHVVERQFKQFVSNFGTIAFDNGDFVFAKRLCKKAFCKCAHP